jgi:hypothetical protein
LTHEVHKEGHRRGVATTCTDERSWSKVAEQTEVLPRVEAHTISYHVRGYSLGPGSRAGTSTLYRQLHMGCCPCPGPGGQRGFPQHGFSDDDLFPTQHPRPTGQTLQPAQASTAPKILPQYVCVQARRGYKGPPAICGAGGAGPFDNAHVFSIYYVPSH